uniref:CREG-like beta-barrel domain-containing protein n=1 Tax=Chenopodium quinoa TaxID=63459 RepID=A0A803KQP7_CHEQI
METLSSSVFLTKISEKNNPGCQLPQFSIKRWNNRSGCLRINESLNLGSWGLTSEKVGISGSSRVLAASKKVSGGESENKPSSDDAHATASDDVLTFPEQEGAIYCILYELEVEEIAMNFVLAVYTITLHVAINSHPTQSLKRSFNDASKMVSTPAGSGSGSGGTRAGLFRTPISGGVQSATSAHGLPSPALAVRNLMEQARFAHLCTVMSRMHHRRQGYPFGSLVDFAPDAMGHPIFSFSPLAIHTRNLLADPRCTLVVQIPGWSGLSNARVTIFGDVYPLPEDQQLICFPLNNESSDIYFIGGFGTVAWVDVKEYEDLKPDKIALEGGEQYLKELNAIFSKPLKKLLSTEVEVDDAALISIDSRGTDVRVRQGAQFNIQRISFEDGKVVETLEEAKSALQQLINNGQLYNIQK